MLQRLLCCWLLMPACVTLYAQSPQRFDVLITELFPDPSPSVGLPENEFIELKNVTLTAINLKGWKLSDGSATATINMNLILQPDSFLIICPNAAVASYGSWGTTIGVTSFPALNNEGDVITLYAPDGRVIHAVAYKDSWYDNAVKAGGGWTLEMIDPANPCAGAGNWKASTHASGGTPGQANAVNGHNVDDMPPALLRTWCIDSVTLVAVFDESLDSVTAAVPDRFSLRTSSDNSTVLIPLKAAPLTPLYNEVVLTWAAPIDPEAVYWLTVKGVTDCSGLAIGSHNTTKAGRPLMADTQDVVINEIMFNPTSGGYDYIEVYNRSNKVVDLKQLQLGNRTTAGGLTNMRAVSSVSQLLFPGEYRLFTEDAGWVTQHYTVKNRDALMELTALPSMPDDKGAIVLTNVVGIVTDELHYDRKWHFRLISNEDGGALERINYNQHGQNANNWMSAASTAGFGTPGYQNSQFRADLQVKGTLSVAPAVFSPDHDGMDDLTAFEYKVDQPGYVANITIFDAGGLPVRHLARNASLGLNGVFRWDGLNDQQRALPIGHYIARTEMFNLQGKIKKFTHAVTLVRRL